jgi:glycosyltransferase involved in cell wall biosynthesis
MRYAMVKIFAKIVEKIPAKLLLAGDGPERSEVEQLVRELNLKDSVRFLGKLV